MSNRTKYTYKPTKGSNDWFYTLPSKDQNIRVEALEVRPLIEEIEQIYWERLGAIPSRGTIVSIAIEAYRDYIKGAIKKERKGWKPKPRARGR